MSLLADCDVVRCGAASPALFAAVGASARPRSGVAAAVTAADQQPTELDDVINRTGPMRVGGEQLITALVDQETGDPRVRDQRPGGEPRAVRRAAWTTSRR